ncbi:histidine phosphatase family protein [Aquirufa novilacunae]|uniref:Histidine phosphatase family protein n=1 Tax=Aquirufa novilacunae TaxID=3139305 RepID=A0ABW8U657_9BACT
MNLYVVRHGNTFLEKQVPVRIGQKTNLPLVESGVNQAVELGKYFLREKIIFDVVFCSFLDRTKQTADLIMNYQPNQILPIQDVLFNEIDHGIDEGKSDTEIKLRIGEKALFDWDQYGIVPEGWIVDEENRKKEWRIFINKYKDKFENILVVTSNGSARFLLKSFNFSNDIPNLKLRTGSFSKINFQDENRVVIKQWDKRP